VHQVAVAVVDIRHLPITQQPVGIVVGVGAASAVQQVAVVVVGDAGGTVVGDRFTDPSGR
jgi:hypothetical protein